MNTQHILFLHGGGTSDKNTTKYLQDELKRLEIHTYSFDFSGQGENTTPLRESSLSRRCQEAKDAIVSFRLAEPLIVCGSSMGGYIAIKLLETYEIENLILFCPAVYDVKAFTIPFDETFSSTIRVQNSWLNSDAFEILKKYTGKVLIVIGENDEIIPQALVKLIHSSLIHASYKKIVTIPGCPHKIHGWLRKDDVWKTKIVETIRLFLEM